MLFLICLVSYVNTFMARFHIKQLTLSHSCYNYLYLSMVILTVYGRKIYQIVFAASYVV